MKSIFEIHTIVLGPLETNCFIVVDPISKQALVIDPADEGDTIWNNIQDNHWSLNCIAVTHGHFDHIGGVSVLKELSQSPVAINKSDANMLENPKTNFSALMGNPLSPVTADIFLTENDTISLGDVQLQVLHTPGHTQGSISFLGDDFVIVGDTLFRDSIGRTDFPGSSHDLLIRSIHDKLFILADSFRVYPGHGPDTTIGRERKGNPFFVGDKFTI